MDRKPPGPDWVSVPAPAKINLFLHVTGRRPDGYHSLQTAFRMLEHGDTLHLRVRADGEVRRLNEVPGVPEAEDLVVRAARLLQARTGCTLGADIQLEKRLPMGGGLGGGSSDAASVLLALNRLWGLHCPRSSLQAWALVLGADVPFFVFGRTAMAGGVGEHLQALDLPPAWYVVVEPPVAVPTPQIFRDEGLTRNSESLIIAGFPAMEILRRIEEDARNDLQSVACRLYPQVAQALELLARHGSARMSGSGACVFVPQPDREAARAVQKAVQKELDSMQQSGMHQRPWRSWCAASLDVHPLRDWAPEA